MHRISTITFLLVCMLMLTLLVSCSTGNGGPLIRGKLQHNYGRSVDNRDVVITIDSTQITADKRGFFYYRTEPGHHSITAAHYDFNKGISLLYIGNKILGENELLDLTVYLRDSDTVDGWALYRKGDFDGARSEFIHLLNSNSNDALNGLGWCTWMTDRDYDAAFTYFHKAVKEVRNIEARVGLCGIELNRVNIEGNVAFGRALQNMHLALNEPDGFSTYPRHDAVREGDLWALNALLSYVSGNNEETEFILENRADQLENETNAHGQDLLGVLESFMGG